MKSEKRIILEKFSSLKHWINVYNKLWKNFLKKWTLKWRISKMKIMIERENTERNQSLIKILKLKEVEGYVKMKKTLLNIMSREKSRNKRQIELRSLSCDRCPLICIKFFPLTHQSPWIGKQNLEVKIMDPMWQN